MWSFTKEPSSWCAYTIVPYLVWSFLLGAFKLVCPLLGVEPSIKLVCLLGVELSSWSLQFSWCAPYLVWSILLKKAFNSVGVPLPWSYLVWSFPSWSLQFSWGAPSLVWSILLGAFHSVVVPLHCPWSFPAWSLQFSWCAPSFVLLSLVWSYLLEAFKSVGVPTSWSLQPQSIGVPTLLGVELGALSLQVGVPYPWCGVVNIEPSSWCAYIALLGVEFIFEPSHWCAYTWCGVQVCLYCLGALGVCLISSGAASMDIN